MADINSRINELRSYFVSFNIAEGTIYALVRFPEKWTVPQDIAELKVKTTYDNQTKGHYFFTEFSNGTDTVFDGIEYVIVLNKTIEERSALLRQKANELTELFASEPIERLRTLKFTFDDETPVRKSKNKPESEKSVSFKKNKRGRRSKKAETTENEEKTEEVAILEPEIKEEEVEINNRPAEETINVEGSSLLNFAESMTDEQ